MYRDHHITAVVPAHNEERHIGKVVTTMPHFVDRIIIVDDKSIDGTLAVIAACGDPRVVVVEHEVNRGPGAAGFSGAKKSLELGGDINVTMDGDGQMDPSYIPALLDPIIDDGVGFTKANRFFSRNSFAGMPHHRIWGNIALSFMNKLASGYWHIFDPENGFWAIRQDVLSRLDLDAMSHGYSHTNDLLINLSILSVRGRDVPVPAFYGDEVSGIRLYKVIPQLLNLFFYGFWKRIFLKYVLMSFSPIALLLFVGMFLTAWGGVWGVINVIMSIGGTPTAATALISVAPLMTGIYMLVQALVLDIQESAD